jgi:hypothetical protein
MGAGRVDDDGGGVADDSFFAFGGAVETCFGVISVRNRLALPESIANKSVKRVPQASNSSFDAATSSQCSTALEKHAKLAE